MWEPRLQLLFNPREVRCGRCGAELKQKLKGITQYNGVVSLLG